jgi:hypothetical protein
MIRFIGVAPLKLFHDRGELLAILGEGRVVGDLGNQLLAIRFGVHVGAILLVCKME